MTTKIDRRTVLAAGAGALMTPVLPAAAAPSPVRNRIDYFDYGGVTLLPSRFLDQVRDARDFYFNMSEDDMLKGFRRNAGLPAPGNDMKGWCRDTCDATFGQWLSGMARMSRALGDTPLRDKAIRLVTEWDKTIGRNGRVDLDRWGTYGWEKMSCGLVDLAIYADHAPAIDILRRITEWASAQFDRGRPAANVLDRDGRRANGTLEWYTLAENSLRAFQLTGDPAFRDFAMLWRYPAYWDQFATTSRPRNAALLHSYSHMNTFSSAAMVYAVTGDPHYLAIIRNAYDWARETQCFASGGFGPGEWTVPADGSLGRALEVRLDDAEIPCGSWAGFKLSRYLTGFTGEARYGDWVETLLHNGIGAALPIQPDGRSYYYADYRVGQGAKTYFWDEWPCCSGTYIQAIADYHNVIYQHDRDGLFLSQLIPSEVAWDQRGVAVRVRLETRYPDEDTSRLTLALVRPAAFKLRFRVPAWCDAATFTVNGAPITVTARPNDWAVIDRRWHDGDVVAATFPMRPRLVPVDAQHPNRVAVMYGPTLMAQNARFSFPIGGEPSAVRARLKRKPSDRLALRYDGPDDLAEQGGQAVGELVPLHTFGERVPYRAYFDLDRARFL